MTKNLTVLGSDDFRFEPGRPACPVGCRYCYVTEVNGMREAWNKKPRLAMTDAATFVLVSPAIPTSPAEQEAFRTLPWHILRGDIVGFSIETDPLWPLLHEYLWEWLARTRDLAKIVTCISKWPVHRDVLARLAEVPNFRLLVGITGNQAVEKVSTAKHLETLALAKQLGLKALPICHPYITGMSDLGFLPQLRDLGYGQFSIRGLRYCHDQMADWMPADSRRHYEGHEDQDVLPEDGWRDLVQAAGLQLVTLKDWFLAEAAEHPGPSLLQPEAEQLVEEAMGMAFLVSDLPAAVIKAAAIQRRL